MGGIQTYRGCIQINEGHPCILGCLNIWGHPSVWQVYGHPFSLMKHALFVLYMYSRHPNIFQTYGASKHTGGCPNRGDPNIQGVHSNKWGIQTYCRCQNIWGHQNIWGIQMYWGVSNHIGSSKHTGGIQRDRGIWTPPESDKAYFLFVVYVQQASKHSQGHQTYGECPNIQRTSKHRDAQAYRGYPNIWGIQTYRGLSKHIGHPKIQGMHPMIWSIKYMGVSKHMGGIQT